MPLCVPPKLSTGVDWVWNPSALPASVIDVNGGAEPHGEDVVARGQKGVTRHVSNTQAEAAVMAQVAAKFEDTQASLKSTLTRLMREVESVRADWQGSGGNSQMTAGGRFRTCWQRTGCC